MISAQAFSASSGVSAILEAGMSMSCAAMISIDTYSWTLSRRTWCPAPPGAERGLPDSRGELRETRFCGAAEERGGRGAGHEQT